MLLLLIASSSGASTDCETRPRPLFVPGVLEASYMYIIKLRAVHEIKQLDWHPVLGEYLSLNPLVRYGG